MERIASKYNFEVDLLLHSKLNMHLSFIVINSEIVKVII